MLANGEARGISRDDGTLLASSLVLPYGEATGSGFAWISMVLVLPEHRRRGLASRLLSRALAELKQRGLTPILDATPAGRTVYAREGFHDTWSFKRYRREPRQSRVRHSQRPHPALSPGHANAIRPIAPADWPSIIELDRPAFGADRELLLRALAERLPQVALVADAGDRIDGYVLGRDGLEASQLGPLLARDVGIARRLLDAALGHLPGPIYIDVADRQQTLRSWLDAAGFDFQRPFTRMVHGGRVAPGDATNIVAVAGPELG